MEKIKVTEKTYGLLEEELRAAETAMNEFVVARTTRKSISNPGDRVDRAVNFTEEQKTAARLKKAEDLLRKYRPISLPKNNKVVALGTWVKIELKRGHDVPRVIEGLVDGTAVRGNGRVFSLATPFGKSLIGRKAGEKFQTTCNSGKVEISILSIRV